MPRSTLGKPVKALVLALFLIVNLAIARPAEAGLLVTDCPGPEQGDDVCCQYCLIFCGCPE